MPCTCKIRTWAFGCIFSPLISPWGLPPQTQLPQSPDICQSTSAISASDWIVRCHMTLNSLTPHDEHSPPPPFPFIAKKRMWLFIIIFQVYNIVFFKELFLTSCSYFDMFVVSSCSLVLPKHRHYKHWGNFWIVVSHNNLGSHFGCNEKNIQCKIPMELFWS